MTKPKLLVVDDDEDICVQMKWALGSDYEVLMAGDRTAAIAAFTAERPVVTLLDLGLPPRPNDPDEGLAVLSGLLVLDRLAKVIVVSGQGDKQNALRAVGAGAYDFLCKPVEVDDLKLVLRRAVYVAELEREYRAMQEHARPDAFEEMLGTSPQMQAVFAFVRKVATTSAPVLILGENGTGKEMVARALHRRSRQSGGPFVPINCNAIPDNLLESELFGHEKGSFTGAHVQRRGLIETAAGGTLFLDEIGELPAPLQVKLLRYLQEKTFQRVGGRQEIQSDARVVAATNLNLQESVATGRFREDLYFRLAVLVVTLPALRERGDDVGLVASEFLRRYGVQHGRPGLSFAPDALRALNRHGWPGNVRELQNRVQRAVIMAEGKRVTASDLELADALNTRSAQTLKEARENLEREVVGDALRRHAGKITVCRGGTRHQPADAVRIDGEAWDRQGVSDCVHESDSRLSAFYSHRGSHVVFTLVNRDVIGQGGALDRSDRTVLDMDSSESPVHGQQEGSAYNGHFESVCYHPLFLFNDHGDCVAAKLRSGSADDWDELLLPEIDRQQAEMRAHPGQQESGTGNRRHPLSVAGAAQPEAVGPLQEFPVSGR